MTDRELRMAILNVCKVAGSDSDINITGFHALCDQLKELGAKEERERLRQYAAAMIDSWTMASNPDGLKQRGIP